MSYYKSIAGWLENGLKGGLCLSVLPQTRVSSGSPISSSRRGRCMWTELCPQGAFVDEGIHLIKQTPEFRAKCNLAGDFNSQTAPWDMKNGSFYSCWWAPSNRPVKSPKTRLSIVSFSPAGVNIRGIPATSTWAPEEGSAATLHSHQGKAGK